MKDLKPLCSDCENTNLELRNIGIRLKELEGEKQQLLQRQKILNDQRAQTKPIVNQLHTDQKVLLFQSLFKGRTDIFANRWQNKQGRSGYSVACHNEWQSGKCNKPKVKCS
ncbi:MAG: hypothetical protein GQ547_00055, partial [Methylophaga sp.]|nr:hypothetical protein [Methylophaga sp.]